MRIRAGAAHIAGATVIGVVTATLGLASSRTLPAAPRPSFPRAAAQETGAQESMRSVRDGVYSKEQAGRGQRIYRAHCEDCHKPAEFRTGYATAYEIFTSRGDMPQNSPGVLNAQQYADLIAYIFEANGMPPGEGELKGDPDVMKRIRIDIEKPPRR